MACVRVLGAAGTHGSVPDLGHGGTVVLGFRKGDDDIVRDSTGKRRGWEEGLTVRGLLSSYDLAVDGDDEEAAMFSSGSRRNGGEGRCSGLPVLGVDVEEEDDLAAEACACSARPEALHSSPSTTTPLCFHPRHQKFREEKGENGEEKTAAAEREEEGKARVRARPWGGFKEEREQVGGGQRGGGSSASAALLSA